MGKTVKFFICWLLALSFLSAAPIHHDQLKQFDQEFRTASNDEVLKLHHMLKNIYIQSIIANDKELKIGALKRLVQTSLSLKLNAASYQKELATLEKFSPPKPPVLPAKPLVPLAPKEPVLINTSKPVQKVVSTKRESAPLAILDIEKIEGAIKLKMNRDVDPKEIKTFRLKSQGAYRYVFDMKGMLMGTARTYQDKAIDLVRVAQYNQAVARVVFSHHQPLEVTTQIEGDSVLITAAGDSQEKVKSVVTKKPFTPSPFRNGFDPKKTTIVIDAGHGGKDSGAVGYKRYYEKKVVLQIALKLGKELKRRGYRIYYTRTSDKFIQLRDRTKIANDKNADLFLSIHANAAPKKSKYLSMKGLETFFLSPARSERSKNVAALENKSDIDEMNHFSQEAFLNFMNREKIIASNKMALDVQQGMLSAVGKKYDVTDGGVREAPFWVLVGAQMPSVLIEVGYITNPTDAQHMVNPTYQTLLANGIASGVDSYFYKNN